ncbi:hypothetical protein [Streptomyces nogalater]|uniref:TetR family transcriptional regulator n=1 Tax=Streptomyces nogalater TaxID=38314 RepID=A0ABW0WCR8_STRNO
MFSRKPADDPPAPDLDEVAEVRAQMINGFLALHEDIAPAFDAADGMRVDLVARGWSPPMAEMLVATWLQRTLINLTPLIGGPQ